MKRLLTSLAVLLGSLLTTFAQYSGSGNGTEDDPYLIYNENQLSQVSNFLNQEGVVFKLMKDLNLTNWIAENNPSQGLQVIFIEKEDLVFFNAHGEQYTKNREGYALPKTLLTRSNTHHSG
jgi:hypothetical protein